MNRQKKYGKLFGIFLMIGVLLSLSVLPAFAEQIVFVQMDGIDGESLDAEHLGWIEASSLEVGTLSEANESMPGHGICKVISFTHAEKKSMEKIEALLGKEEPVSTVKMCLTEDRKPILELVLEGVKVVGTEKISSEETFEGTKMKVTLLPTKVSWKCEKDLEDSPVAKLIRTLESYDALDGDIAVNEQGFRETILNSPEAVAQWKSTVKEVEEQEERAVNETNGEELAGSVFSGGSIWVVLAVLVVAVLVLVFATMWVKKGKKSTN